VTHRSEESKEQERERERERIKRGTMPAISPMNYGRAEILIKILMTAGC
jgi:hypothetical protein